MHNPLEHFLTHTRVFTHTHIHMCMYINEVFFRFFFMWIRIYFADTDADLTPNYGNLFPTAFHMDNIARTAKNYICKPVGRGGTIQYNYRCQSQRFELLSEQTGIGAERRFDWDVAVVKAMKGCIRLFVRTFFGWGFPVSVDA